MTSLNSRRRFVLSLPAATLAAVVPPARPLRAPVPMIHATDLYRPHNDPDDHWDLASVYALQQRGAVDLKAVLIDFPPRDRDLAPDVMGVAQMNYVAGAAVPVLIGAPRASVPARKEATRGEYAGVRGVLDVLRSSPRPVVINIVGSTRDIAIAARLEPRLFASKCAAVYLNAGTGTPDRRKAEQLEYNVQLDPAAYAAIFGLPCPIYWMPCFEEFPHHGEVREWATFFRFQHSAILPALSPRLRNFFLRMYRDGAAPQGPANGSPWDWLRQLDGPADEAELSRQLPLWRNMWCTAGFLHATGLTVSRKGEVLPLRACPDPVFAFVPVQVTCTSGGVTQWKPVSASTRRFLFRVLDVDAYQPAMTAALKSLLLPLG